jgi:hypothetical protein
MKHTQRECCVFGIGCSQISEESVRRHFEKFIVYPERCLYYLKCKGLHVTCLACTEAGWRYSPTQSLHRNCMRWLGDQRHGPAALPLEGSPVPIVQAAGCAAGPVWTSVVKRKCLAPTGVRTPNRPGCSEALYRRRYSGPHLKCC